MNTNKNGILIGLMALSFIWAISFGDFKGNLTSLLNHIDEYGQKIELGPSKADAAGAVTICDSKGQAGDTSKCANVSGGAVSVAVSGGINLSNVTLTVASAVNQGSIPTSAANAWPFVLTDGLGHTIASTFPLYVNTPANGFTCISGCSSFSGTITQGSNGTFPWAVTTWSNGTYAGTAGNPINVNTPSTGITIANNVAVTCSGCAAASSVAINNAISNPVQMNMTDGSNHTISTTYPLPVLQGQTTAAIDSVKAYTADGAGNALTTSTVGTHQPLDVNVVAGGLTGSSVSISNSPTVNVGNTLSAAITGGANFTDNTPFTAGTTTGIIGMGVYNDSLTAVTSGSAGAKRMTSYRAVHTNPRDNSGNELFTSSNPGNERNVNSVGTPVNTVLTLNNTTNAGSSTNPIATNSTVNNSLGNPANVVITANSATNVFASTNPGYVQTVQGGTITGNANTLFSTSVAAAWTVPSSALVTYAQSFSGSTTNVVLICPTSTCDSTHATLGVLTQYQQRKLDYLKPGTTIWAATNGANASAIFWSVAP